MTLNHTLTKQFAQALLIILTVACSLGFGDVNSAAAQADTPVGCTREWYDGYLVAAYTLGLEDFELHAALNEGKTIADIAGEMGVDIQPIIDALVDVESGLVRKMEQGNCLTTEEANAWIAGLPAKMREFIGDNESVDPAAQPNGNTIFLPILLN